MPGRRLLGVVAAATLAVGAQCIPKTGQLGASCTLACTNAVSTSFCQSVDDICDSALKAPCVGIVASGGTCSRACVRDDDCRGAEVPMVCSGDCLRDESICLRVGDAQQFCKRTLPVLSCTDLHLRGDGICDGPKGTNLCADDAADCGDVAPWTAACATMCAQARAMACPMDDLSQCEQSCVSGVADPACRAELKAMYECDTRPDAHTCGADQKSQPTGACDAAIAAAAACQKSFYGL